jgi:hypothetical protein
LKRDLGMNKMNHFSKALSLIYHYSHIYELEYSSYVTILAYELAYSFYVMNLAYWTLCLIIHITYVIRNRVKLRWRFIMASGVLMSYACRSVGSESLGDVDSFFVNECGARVHRNR